ncbi:hypothetical protein HanPSC8_Chr10g0448731 [Helianthus annuus]|nr:hypothetical protein HanPSC8_Chr10g0448731 [Helianthus annuus]
MTEKIWDIWLPYWQFFYYFYATQQYRLHSWRLVKAPLTRISSIHIHMFDEVPKPLNITVTWIEFRIELLS